MTRPAAATHAARELRAWVHQAPTNPAARKRGRGKRSGRKGTGSKGSEEHTDEHAGDEAGHARSRA